jgi:hypothetical protein
VLGEEYFHSCEALEPVTFEAGSTLEGIESHSKALWFQTGSLFWGSTRLEKFIFLCPVEVIDTAAFCGCIFLELLSFKAESTRQRVKKTPSRIRFSEPIQSIHQRSCIRHNRAEIRLLLSLSDELE